MNIMPFSNTTKTMSSREIAELCEKRHDNVCRDIEKLNESYAEMGLLKIEEGYYTHPNTGNQRHRQFLLTHEQTLDLVTGYKLEVRIRINRRWLELEAQQVKPQITLPNFADPAEAAIAWAAEYRAKQIALAERDHAIATKAEIGSRREATAMATASAKTKEANKLRIQLDRSLEYASVKKVQAATNRSYAWQPLRDWCWAHKIKIHKVFDANYEKGVNAYSSSAWLAVYGVDLTALFGGAA